MITQDDDDRSYIPTETGCAAKYYSYSWGAYDDDHDDDDKMTMADGWLVGYLWNKENISFSDQTDKLS